MFKDVEPLVISRLLQDAEKKQTMLMDFVNSVKR
jgi:hypothetical protein